MLPRIFAAMLVASTLAAQTSSISGTIRNAYNLIPIPGVLVQLNDGDRLLETFTDATGHYRFSDLEQNSYNLRIEKHGYLFQPDYALSHQGTIVLEDTPLSLDYVMDQWSSLAGCVRDADGKPVADATITLTPNGTPRGTPAATTSADGCYEVERVFAGSYYLEARLAPSSPPQPPTFYPSTANPSEALRVPVAPGSPRNGVNIQLAQPRLGVISGRVVNEEGKPLEDVQINLNPAESGISSGPINVAYMPGRFQPPPLLRIAPNDFPVGEIRSVRSAPDGTFRIAGLVPGAWRLFVTSNPRNGLVYASQPVELAPPTEAAPETTVELSARTMFETKVQLDWSGPPPSLLRGLAINFCGTVFSPSSGDLPKVVVAPTSLALPLVCPGPFSLSSLAQSESLPDGYYFAFLRQGGADLQGQPAQLTRNAPPITLVFKPKAAQIRGTLEAESAAIVVLWGNDLTRDAVVRTSITPSKSNFYFGSLAPGTYHLAAFDRLPPEGLTRTFLNTLTPSAATVTLTEGDTAIPKISSRQWLN